MQGQVFLKGRSRGWYFFYLSFSSFIILNLEIILLFSKVCYAFEEKQLFSALYLYEKKVILNCIKMKLCVYVRKFGVSNQDRRDAVCVRVERNCLKYLKRWWNRKEGRGNKHFNQRDGKLRPDVGLLKRGSGTTLRTIACKKLKSTRFF